MKNVVVLFIVIVFIFCACTLAQGNSNPQTPQIYNFKISYERSGIKVSFFYREVSGGLKKALFTIGYVVERDGVIVEEGIQDNLELSPTKMLIKGKEGEDGYFETVISDKDAKKGLKSGDEIKYFIFLNDSKGRKSNIIFYEFKFVEKFEI